MMCLTEEKRAPQFRCRFIPETEMDKPYKSPFASQQSQGVAGTHVAEHNCSDNAFMGALDGLLSGDSHSTTAHRAGVPPNFEQDDPYEDIAILGYN
jgi:hypothetical protein